ncbi:hypothetical protein PYCC9005_005680 [Savitreella phatthalungensis]
MLYNSLLAAGILGLASAAPGDLWRRQNTNSSASAGISALPVSVSLNGSTPSGGAGVGAGFGNSSTPATSTVTTTVNGGAGVGAGSTPTSSPLFTYTTLISSTTTQVFAIPINGVGAVPVNGIAPVAAGAGAAPTATTTVFVTTATVTSTIGVGGVNGNGQCVCAGPAITATGVVPVTVQTAVVVGPGNTVTTSGVVTTIAPFVLAGGSAVPVTPIYSTTVFPATNTNSPAPAGQQYQTITIPASGTSPAYVIVVLVTVTNQFIPVVTNSLPAGAGVGAQPTGIYSNTSVASSFTNTALGSVSTGATQSTAFNPTSGVPVTSATTTPVASTTMTSGNAGVAAAYTTLSNQGSPRVTDQNWIDSILSQHNAYRARHSAGAMTWNNDLAQAALANVNYNIQNTANPKDEKHTSEYSSNPYGENIGFIQNQNNPQTIVYLWYDEEPKYTFNPSSGFSGDTGHFTQLVWLASSQLGCAYAVRSSDNVGFMACEYSPAGNVNNGNASPGTAEYNSFFQSNVLPPDNSIPYPTAPPANI